MNRMGISENVIHKGEKEEKYQLYVEDYVMSYLKNYGTKVGGNIFFFGKREGQERKYYIYGAGEERQIPYFENYELLEEITYRDVMDKPVFFIREALQTYELAGYDIFYQSNEAMQNYMVEQRKKTEKTEPKEKAYAGNKISARGKEIKIPESQAKAQTAEKIPKKPKNGLMAAQLSAIFVILAAIAINSTNSYTKLTDLGQAAVEVFFAMENQEASGEGIVNPAPKPEEKKENILRLEELDAKFEEENQAAKQEESEEETAVESGADAPVQEEESADAQQEQETEVAVMDEISPSEQAFARNFAEFYQIEKGDTLYTISIKIYGDTSKVKEICELNKITDPDNIKYGQKILLP